MADDAGALLVRSGLVTSAALEAARAKVADHGGTLGEQLVTGGTVDDDKLTDFYKQRLLVPQVNPNTLARLPAKVVAVIPSEMAIELRAIPVSLDSDNNLTVAMSDPSDRHAVDEIAFFTGSYVVRAVATQMQIAWCLAHYYGHVTELGERLLQPDNDPVKPKQQPRLDSQPALRPRTRSPSDEIEAQRHKGIIPGEVFVEGKAPAPDKASKDAEKDADKEVTGTFKAEEPTGTFKAEEPTKPRSKTASGEIRVPQVRAQSIKPPMPDDSGPFVVLEDIGGELEASGPVPASASGPVEAKRDSDPVIEIEAEEGSEYEPVIEVGLDSSKPVPRRRRPADSDPPELAARAGEVQLATGQPIKKIEFDEPRIILSDELADEIAPARKLVPSIQVSGELRIVREHRDKGPTDEELSSIFVELGADEDDDDAAIIHDQRVDESGPVLLDRRRLEDPTAVSIHPAPQREISDERSEPIELPPKRVKQTTDKRKKVKTQVGLGVVSAGTKTAVGDTGIPSEIDDAPTDAAGIDIDPTRIDARAAPPPDEDLSDEVLAPPPKPYQLRDTSKHIAPPTPGRGGTPPPSGQVRLDGVKRAAIEDEDDGQPTNVMDAVDDGDDGWGPPGTTIPPPLLGAIPGAITPASGIIPIADVDSAPLIVAPPVPPERGARAQTTTEAGLSRALEEATARVLELIHTLDHTTDRDQIIAVMIAHLAESHRRAGFFAMRAGALSLFAITPRIAEMATAELRLDRASTLGDVVGTRLPYRGPMLDDASRSFLSATLGACPPEILLVPIAVRERVVGVLFGDQRIKHTFDDQLALSARAAGFALERLLKAKRG